MKFDLTNYYRLFPKKWIEVLKKEYFEMLEKARPQNHVFFSSTGHGNHGRRNVNIKEITDYFEGLLYAPNLACLDYVMKNRSQFQKLNFVDYGCGLGLLSVFLKKLGIACYNHDNFSQLGDVKLSSAFYKKYGIPTPHQRLPEREVDGLSVFVSSGVIPDSSYLLKEKFDFLFIDEKYRPIRPPAGLWDSYEAIETYEDMPTDMLSVYKREAE